MMLRNYRVVLALLLCVALLVGCSFATAEELEVPLDEAVDAVQDDSPVIETDGQDGGDLDADLLNPGLELDALAVGESLESADVAVDNGEIAKAQESGAGIVANTDDPDYFTVIEKDGLEYEYYPYNKELKCYNFAFDNTMDLEEQIHNYPSKLIVPAEVEMTFSRGDPAHLELYTQIVPVISIGSGFGASQQQGDQWYVKNLSEVVVPDSISSIDSSAFANNRIKSFTFPPLVTVIQPKVLENCPDLESVSFMGDITEIGGWAFHGCSSLKKISIPDTVEKIWSAFEDCVSLESVTLGKGLTMIGDNCFRNCNHLQKIVIPGCVKSIGEYAFYCCESLNNITISDGVETIEDGAFACSKDLKRILIPASVKTIGEHAFGYHGWKIDRTHSSMERIKDFVIVGEKGSAAEAYAEENYFYFMDVNAPKQSPKPLKKSLVLGDGESVENALSEKSPVDAKDCTFASSDPSVVRVDENGKLKARKPGTATVTIESKVYLTKTRIKVKVCKAPNKLTVTPSKKKLKAGKTLQLKVKLPSGTASRSIRYASSKPKIASVSKTGKIKALKPGKAVITVKTFNGKNAKVNITVVK